MTEESPPPAGGEQRRSPRIPMPPGGGPISIVGAKLLNVSAYGVLIETPLAMEAEAVMPLRVVLFGEKVDVQARVAQCVPAPGPRRAFRIGLEFLSPTPGFRERVAEALKAL